MRTTTEFAGGALTIRRDGLRYFTPMFVVIVALVVVYAPMFSDINSASVFVSRRRVSSPRCARSVLRIDTAPQRNDAICARFDASFTVSRRE